LHDLGISFNRLRFGIDKLNFDAKLDGEIAALEQNGHGKLISSPRLITSDGRTAKIESGEEIPYQEKTSSGATSVTFKKAVLSLQVTPYTTTKNIIRLRLKINKDRVSPVLVNGVPAIKTEELQTDVLVRAGQTVVLGGIIEQRNNQTVDGIPSRIPLLRAVFQRHHRQNSRQSLYVFVTPVVIG